MALREFSWVIEGELAGMSQPDGLPEDLAELRRLGVAALVNLTPEDWPREVVERSGLAYLQLPIEDFSPPRPEQVDAFVEFCEESILRGRPVAVHCRAGRGRTGTMIACYLVRRGMSAEEAIGRTCSLRPGSIETCKQKQAVRDYEARCRRRG